MSVLKRSQKQAVVAVEMIDEAEKVNTDVSMPTQCN